MSKKNIKKLLAASTILALAFCAFSVVKYESESYVSAASTATTAVNVTIAPVISIATTDGTIDVSTTPTASGATVEGSEAVTVTTNNATGYTVYVTSSSAQTTLKHSNTTVTTKFDTITAAAATVSDIAADHWGWYSNTNSTYEPVVASGTANSTSNTLSKTTAPSTSGSSINLKIGAKATNSMVSGVYSNTLLLTAVANS